MTANQCHRPNLGNPEIYESFSVCSWRGNTAGQCCTTPHHYFQCWNYCAVEESQFPNWLNCVQEKQNSTWGAACQRADQSPVLTATTPYPAAFTQPTPPEGYYEHLNGRGVNATNASATTTLAFAGNSTTSTHLPSPSSSNVKQSGSTRALELSVGGLMCALLAFSTLAI